MDHIRSKKVLKQAGIVHNIKSQYINYVPTVLSIPKKEMHSRDTTVLIVI